LNKFNKESDEWLVNQYKDSGNNDFFAELFKRYSHLVFGVCMKYLKDKDNAKDAVMSIFEKLLTDLKKHNIEIFKAWLHTVAKNHCLMLLRKKNHFIQFNENISVENNDVKHREEKINQEIKINLLDSAVENLDQNQKVCVRMFYIEEKSYREIMLITGFNYNEVKSNIQNGKRNMQLFILKNEKK
jgi:RNA polymerase sigma factor (sigma-70 family)